MEDMIALANETLRELELTGAQRFKLHCYREQMKKGMDVDIDALFDFILSLPPGEIC